MTSISQRPAIEGVLVSTASTAVKSPALNVAIGVSAVVMVVGLVLWFMQLSGGMVQTAMRNPRQLGPLHHGLHVFRGPVGRRSYHLVGAQGPRHPRLRRYLESGGVLIHRLHGGRHRSCSGGYGPALPRVGAVRLLQSGQPAYVGYHCPFHLPHPVVRIPVGPDSGRARARSALWPCASSR